MAVSQAVAEGGVEGQGWDEMLNDQRWDTAAAVATVVVGALISDPPPAPVVVNINVPNCNLDAIKAWRRAEVGAIPPRVVKDVRLEPKIGHPGAFHVRMDWGDAVVLPADTDGGAVERDEVALTYLTGLTADPTVGCRPSTPPSTVSSELLCVRAGELRGAARRRSAGVAGVGSCPSAIGARG